MDKSKVIPNINDPDFSVEDEFFRRSCKLLGIAELFSHVCAEERPVFSDEAYLGISQNMKDTVKELRVIFYHAWQEGGA